MMITFYTVQSGSTPANNIDCGSQAVGDEAGHEYSVQVYSSGS